jgi:hypothetical protein
MKTNYVKFISAVLLFGSNGIVASHVALGSHEIVLWRTLIGSLFLLAVFVLTGGGSEGCAAGSTLPSCSFPAWPWARAGCSCTRPTGGSA